MELSLYQKHIFNRYKSNSQRARVLSESWFDSEMYCPCCLNDSTEKFKDNRKVYDFMCPRCANKYQLKSSSRPFTKRVLDGQYNTLNEFVASNLAPNFFLMHYSSDDWFVKDLFLIPKFFISTSLIEKRKPLKSTARRAGWIGCNLLLDRIPEDGKISVVKSEREIDKRKVHKTWERMSFLNRKKPHLRGWTSDVLKCIEDLSKGEFTLQDAYGFVDYLQELHPDNRHVQEKIRQQLQVLRDHGILRFVSPGQYRFIR